MKDRFKFLFEMCARIAGSRATSARIRAESSSAARRSPRLRLFSPSARGITQIWELDKDDAESIGAIKFDVLSCECSLRFRILNGILRILKCEMRDAKTKTKTKNEIGEAYTTHHSPLTHSRSLLYDRIPFDDPATYKMIRAAEGDWDRQHESAAQMALAVTLRPEHFEDLVAAVALICPGPIQGHVVQRFVACRNGWARADMLHPALAETLDKTYGCVVFQEQVNEVVRIMTGCTDAEADRSASPSPSTPRWGRCRI